jgi:predicted O-methyltransferase YrrM
MERVGLHVIPTNYYSPIASRRELRRTEAEWRRPLHPFPFLWDIDAQADWVSQQAGSFPLELPLDDLACASKTVGGLRYGAIEAQFLYSWIRCNSPRRILEVGSGSSTLVMSKAVERNCAEDGRTATICAFDPYMASVVGNLPHVDARAAGGQKVASEALELRRGDLLFIDSTHAVRTGSELSHLYLEVIPRLRPGVVVHVHDIYFPYLFSPEIYSSPFDWQETTLLAALLTGNDKLRVLASLSALHYEKSDVLKTIFPEYMPLPVPRGIVQNGRNGHFPSSTWLEAASGDRKQGPSADAPR